MMIDSELIPPAGLFAKFVQALFVATLLTALAMTFICGSAAQAATFVATPAADAPDATPGDGMCATATDVCTLRAAVQEANALDGPDSIMLQSGTYLLTLTGTGEDAAATGDLDVTDDLTITGPDDGRAVIDGNHLDRAFDVFAPAQLTISQIMIQDGTAAGAAGGAIRNRGALTLTACTLARNTAGDGGGIANIDLGMAQLTNVTISSNGATAGGGGIANLNAGTLTLTNATISDNSAVAGGGIDNIGTAQLKNTIVARNTPGGDCAGRFVVSLGHNLSNGNTCPGFDAPSDINNKDPLLGLLENNGGPTFTQALLAGSPAIDAGDNSDCPATDQRGEPRPADGDHDGSAICDIGAYEVPGPMPPTPTATATGTETPTPSPTPSDTPASPTLTPPRPSLILGTATGNPGEQVSFNVILSTAGVAIVGSNNDAAFDALHTPIAAKIDGTPDCIVNPALPDVASAFVFRPNGCSGTECTGVFAAVFPTFPINPIPDGAILYACRVTISPLAAPGEYPLTVGRIVLSDPDGMAVPGAFGTNGKIVVLTPPTPTASPTETATPSPSPTPTITQTPTPTPIRCVGDCDARNRVTITNIIVMVNIALGTADVSACRAGDVNHDNMVVITEIVQAVNNALTQCPSA
jgi:CSLREA domain-containing protein